MSVQRLMSVNKTLHDKSTRLTLAGAAAAVLLTILVYLPGLHGDFVLDDFPNILDNSALQVTSLTIDGLWRAAFSSEAGALRRPISMLTLALNHYFSGFEPLAYKLSNVIIHLLCGLSLLVLSRQLLQSFRQVREPTLSDAAVRWIPLIIAAFWLVHPLNLTGVLYIVQRMTSLAALFTALALISFIRCRIRLHEERTGWWPPLAASVLFAILAMLSKENGILTPVFALLIELAIFRGRTAQGRIDRRVIAAFALCVGLPTLLVSGFLITHPEQILNGYAGRSFSFTERLLTEPRALVFYLKLLVLPSASSLGLYHDDFTVSSGILAPPDTLVAVLAIMVAVAAGFFLLRRAPILGLGILWFFAGHVLESTIIPLELVYEHRNYLPSYGILLALSYTGFAVGRRLRVLPLAATGAPLVLALFATVTFVRAQQWEDNVTHAISEAINHPHSPRAVYGAGRIYANLYLTGGLDTPDRAFETLERARRLDRDTILPSAAMVMLAAKAQHQVDSRWINTIVERLRNTPLTASTITALKVLAADKATVELVGATGLERILLTALNNPTASGGKRADLLTILGSYYANSRSDYRAARKMFADAVETAPGALRYRLNLIQLLVATGDAAAAEESVAAALAADTLKTHTSEISRLQDAIDAMRGPS